MTSPDTTGGASGGSEPVLPRSNLPHAERATSVDSTEGSAGSGDVADAPKVEAFCRVLGEIAPLRLAESWDNVGLLVGDRDNPVRRVMTCLTVTDEVVAEACEGSADLVVSHHPIPFKPMARITADTITGRLLLGLIESRVAVYSAHTAMDSAASGINQRWAELVGLDDVRPLVDAEPGVSVDQGLGAGRFGTLAENLTVAEVIVRAARAVGVTAPRHVGDLNRPVRRVAIACGSGGSFVAAAHRRGCDMLLTGEATFHACLEAESLGVGLGLLGHFGSERFASEWLAEELAARFPQVLCWASRHESDPIGLVELGIS